MTEPICKFCHKQLPVKRERVLLTGQSTQAKLCIEAAAAYLKDAGSQQTLEQYLSSTSTSAHYICALCSNTLRRWQSAKKTQRTTEEEIRSRTTLHSFAGEMQGTRSPQGALGPPLATSSPIHGTQQLVSEEEPPAKRRKTRTADVQVIPIRAGKSHTPTH